MSGDGRFAVKTTALTKSFGSSRGISGVSVEIHRGEVFGLLGPNGAGKTTLLRCLMDLIHPTSGSAQVLGEEVSRNSKFIRSRVSYLPGEFALWPTLTAGETLQRLGGLRADHHAERVAELSSRFNVDMDRPLGQMSRGNKQKVGLVLALSPVMDVYILDEPTGGLDPIMQQHFREVVATEVERGATILLSSHVLHEVEHLAERVGVLRAGELVAVERVDSLRSRAALPITVTFAGGAPVELLRAVPDVEILTSESEATVSLRVRGAIDPLLKFLAGYEVLSLVAPEAELEEIFLEFYGSGDPS
ncbi:MAG TPA: ABC transporter [Actinobacteria bacterium]|nr:ABC transporter [Actinomycetota bacterium]